MNKTIYCAISSHGFGHIGQSAPILNQLHALRPDIKIIIQCAISRTWLEEQFDFPFEHVDLSSDFGMVMKSALEIDVEASHQAYLDVHEHWDERVADTVNVMKSYQPDLVYCNVAYLVNAAAEKLSIPVINLCSLNWYQTYQAYCAELPSAQEIMQTMLQAYNSARMFLTPEPSMAMPEIYNIKTLGAVAKIGRERGDEIRQQFGLTLDSRLVLVSYGGVEYTVNYHRWPKTPGIYYLVSEKSCIERDDFIAREKLSMPYIDMVSSCDVIMTKSGYGTYAEAACHGKPVMYTRRPDWPEDACLVAWLKNKANCIELSISDLQNGEILEPTRELLRQPKKPMTKPDGVGQAAVELLKYLSV